MKKVMIKSLLLALTVTLMGSCKPTLKVSSDYDRSANFSAYKTFSLYYLVTSRNVTRFNEERIWNAIREEMQKKGYIEDDRNPDIVVNAVSVINSKKYLAANSSGYGYGGALRPYGGMLLGDGCMVTFGAPLSLENPSRSAVAAAVELKQSLQDEFKKGNIPPTKVGIGIHYGDAVTGNIGTETRQQYSVTGNVVIIAARVEQLNKQLNSEILITEEVFKKAALPAVISQRLGAISVKGFEEPVSVYKLA